MEFCENLEILYNNIVDSKNTENINFFENYKINVYIRKKLLYNYYILIIK